MRAIARFGSILVLCLPLAQGCGSTSDAPTQTRPARAERANDDRAAGRAVVDELFAIVNGEPRTWSAVRSRLAEAAGEEILQEIVLEQLLRRECRRAGIVISDSDLGREEELLLDQFSDDPDQAARLLDEVRERRGLGPVRYRMLLTRNAQLRALVADQIAVTPALVQQEYQLLHGDRYRIRLIVVPTLEDAAGARDQVINGRPFGEVATDTSIDISAQRGGLLDPISPADVTYPDVIREALPSLEVGRPSTPLSLGNRYAIIQLDEIIPGDGAPIETVRPMLTERIRLRQERIRMDELARSLLAAAEVTVFEDGVDWIPPADGP
jgi:parvulin-like peptidyl-prolyl isomerase